MLYSFCFCAFGCFLVVLSGCPSFGSTELASRELVKTYRFHSGVQKNLFGVRGKNWLPRTPVVPVGVPPRMRTPWKALSLPGTFQGKEHRKQRTTGDCFFIFAW